MDYFEQRIDRDDKYHGIIVDVHLDNVRLSDGSKAPGARWWSIPAA